MNTIELVDPELRDALALWPLLPLTAKSLMRRRADALELIAAVPKPNLPDVATDEIHVESAFGRPSRWQRRQTRYKEDELQSLRATCPASAVCTT